MLLRNRPLLGKSLYYEVKVHIMMTFLRFILAKKSDIIFLLMCNLGFGSLWTCLHGDPSNCSGTFLTQYFDFSIIAA